MSQTIDELARRVADAAVAEQITRRAYHRLRLLETQDYDARCELSIAQDVAVLELESAVREYRASVEAVAFLAWPEVRRPLEKLGEMED